MTIATRSGRSIRIRDPSWDKGKANGPVCVAVENLGQVRRYLQDPESIGEHFTLVGHVNLEFVRNHEFATNAGFFDVPEHLECYGGHRSLRQGGGGNR